MPLSGVLFVVKCDLCHEVKTQQVTYNFYNINTGNRTLAEAVNEAQLEEDQIEYKCH